MQKCKAVHGDPCGWRNKERGLRIDDACCNSVSRHDRCMGCVVTGGEMTGDFTGVPPDINMNYYNFYPLPEGKAKNVAEAKEKEWRTEISRCGKTCCASEEDFSSPSSIRSSFSSSSDSSVSGFSACELTEDI